MKKFIFSFILLTSTVFIQAQNDYFFPKDIRFDPKIPSPEQFLGYPIGEWHTRHDRIVSYFEKLAELSPRAEVEIIGNSVEHRAQVYLFVSSPENLANKESIRQKHLTVLDPTAALDENQPLIVQLGYGVHGNEASSAEAAMLAAYYLVAAQGTEIEEYLKNAITFVEPVLNPDGRERHTNWVDARRGIPPVADALDSEHQEMWPGGRTNHYWFDLNRDWLPLAQVESQNRVAFYHKWLPNVVTDYHEMGTDATYFFEPTKKYGSENPVVPRYNYDVINPTFAKYFQKSLDEIGSLYWSREVFDNSYPGYGSTYPDIQGGLGLVFEQARSEGRIQNTTTKPLEFKFAIRNHLRTSLATIKASMDNKKMLVDFQKKFFTDAYNDGKKANEYHIFGDENDPTRTRKFVDLLLKHHIKTYQLNQNIASGNLSFKKGSAYVVPTDQPQYLMVRSVFENVTKFHDSVFYDTSAWSMVLAYNLPHAVLKKTKNLEGTLATAENILPVLPTVTKAGYAYLINWTDYNAPKVLHYLLAHQVFVKTSSKPFKSLTDQGEKDFGYGTLLISVTDQNVDADKLYQIVSDASKNADVPIFAVSSGMNLSGVDLGSRNFQTVKLPKVLMPIGDGVSSYEAGEIWHFLDTKVNMPITKADVSDFRNLNLYDYDVIVLVSGNYAEINKDKLKDWVNAGGTLILQRTAINWAIRNGLTTATLKKPETKSDSLVRGNYEDATNFYGSKATGGSYYKTNIDLTHPIGFGYTSPELTVYRNHNIFLNPGKNPFGKVAIYDSNPLISGYVHKENLKQISNSASILTHAQGRGRVILFVDDMSFRGFMFGTNKAFVNALFFGSLIEQD